ncbi:Uncharacterized conserved protein YcbK, DUF882 family [Duganella sp. CF402]|uniref:YcbK family protein n=1 Tax=unclassified Duganella TaxID=2636909 RepID=UPI0008CF8951|nr:MULTISPECIES: DUF882 domain-containing protein [unclassified Duganella]RZT09969.1 uncharacterized protein YcbK (DUF882 family) [Duganella sp. BK701]SEL34786.1 Uncharacterized conserved protein YcbK, DUF882 family [Duganella sp. CF402]
MATRREFLGLTAASFLSVPLIGCASSVPVRHSSIAKPSSTPAAPGPAPAPSGVGMEPPPDIFDAQALDLEFWLRPRTIEVVRPASKERAKLLYWKDGEIIDSAYQDLCHLMRDVNGGNETRNIDPKLFETLWGTQAFVRRYGIDSPLEILSGYRTPASNNKLREAGVPAARQSLHMVGRAADIRIPNLNAEVLGGLVKSFRQGGVGFYYRAGPSGGWIHADTGLQRTWKG